MTATAKPRDAAPETKRGLGGSKPVAVVAGASGFVGTAVVQAFVADGYEVRTIGRTGDVTWADPGRIAQAIDGSDVLVNLAGKSVNCRYTDSNRDEILRSRVETTRALREAVTDAVAPPAVWFNASTATIYRHAMDRPNTEADGEFGKGFSVDVARNWEREFFEGDLPHTRRVALRMAIVLGDGPATNALLTLARIGLGGPQIDGWWFAHRRYRGIGPTPTGNTRPPSHRTKGRQKFSWVHIDDVVNAIRFLRDRDHISGPVNIASPDPTDNRTLMRTLRSAVGMRIGLPARRWMLEPAMWLLRTEPELVLKSRWVVPGTLAEAGFTFEHPHLPEAASALASRGLGAVALREDTTSSAETIHRAGAAQSVYQRAVREDFASLDSELQRYFGPIPLGSVGTGRGIYEVAGSRLRVLRPLLAVMARRRVLFPEFGHDVPFVITNTPSSDGSLSAVRTFEFPGRTRVMEDTMNVAGGQLVDRIGKRRGLEVTIEVAVDSRTLHMKSTGLAVRSGCVRIPLPSLATMHLQESTDHAVPSRQRVDVRLTAPLLGEVFCYTGTFTYAVRPIASPQAPPDLD